MIEYTVTRFQEALQKRLADIQRQTPGMEEVRRERRQLQTMVQRLTDAIADTGHSPALLSKLGEVEARVAELDRHVDSCKPIDMANHDWGDPGFCIPQLNQPKWLVARRREQVESGLRAPHRAACPKTKTDAVGPDL